MDTMKLAEALMVMAFMEETEMKPDDIDQDVWDRSIEIASEWEEHQSLIDQMAIDIGYAIMAGKDEERKACLNEISILAGTPLQPQSALAHAYSAIRKRGEANG